MPRSTYCHHEANPPSDRQATERPTIVEICEKSQFRYGYRRVADTLRKATGVRIADKTVLKVMTLEQRCARLETEAEVLKRTAASAAALSAAGGSAR